MVHRQLIASLTLKPNDGEQPYDANVSALESTLDLQEVADHLNAKNRSVRFPADCIRMVLRYDVLHVMLG